MEIYWQWLCGIPGLYQKEKGLLLQYFGTPEEVWRASERDCRKFGEAGYGWIQKVEKFRKEQDPESFSHRLERIGIQFISQSRTDYPEKLRRIYRVLAAVSRTRSTWPRSFSFKTFSTSSGRLNTAEIWSCMEITPFPMQPVSCLSAKFHL